MLANRFVGALNRDTRDNRGDVRSDDPAFNPFDTCLQLVGTMYAEVEAIVRGADCRWEHLMATHHRTWAYKDEDKRDMFQLVEHLSDEADLRCIIIAATDAANKVKSTAKTTRNIIKEAIRRFKTELLGHPINIILAAFMTKDFSEPIYDYDLKNEIKRTAKDFLDTFPYAYLAAVYKQAFDYVVRKETTCVTTQSMIKDQENIVTYLLKAEKDISKVCH